MQYPIHVKWYDNTVNGAVVLLCPLDGPGWKPMRAEIARILDYDHWSRITLFDMYALGANNEVCDPHYESPAIYKDVAEHIIEGCKSIVSKLGTIVL